MNNNRYRISNYRICDPYILEELSRQYTNGSPRERIRLLKKLGNENSLPYEIALLAVKDGASNVRAWFARNSTSLDYRERDYTQPEATCEFPERNLVEMLRVDSDPYVQACLFENRCIMAGSSMSECWFTGGNHLQRLALMRNPWINESLVLKIFDYEDRSLEIDPNQRRELALAFLTNASALKDSHKDAADLFDPITGSSRAVYFKMLWELAAKWPPESGVPYTTFNSVGAEDVTKEAAFTAAGDEWVKRAILENCDYRDKKTIDLGMHDPDDICRETAYERVGALSSEEFDVLIAGEDTWALSGLACNQGLSVERLKKVRSRLRTLGSDSGDRQASWTIEKLERGVPPQDPRKLFGYEGRRGNFLEDKIDYIGNKLIRLQENIDHEIAGQKSNAETAGFLGILKRIFQ